MSKNFTILVEALQSEGNSLQESLRLANGVDPACTEYADEAEIKSIAQEITEDIRAIEEALSDE